jgi:hypothetical protein
VGKVLKLGAVEEVRSGDCSTVIASIGKVKAGISNGYEKCKGYNLFC